MRRRQFFTILGGTAAWPLAAQAQQIPQIGVLWHAGNEEEEAIYLSALRGGLSNQGYVEGRNCILINTFAGEVYERFISNAAELVRRRVDVIVAVTRLAAVAAQRATTTIPIVFVVVPDPIKSGLVQSLARPGKNITGLTKPLTLRRSDWKSSRRSFRACQTWACSLMRPIPRLLKDSSKRQEPPAANWV